MDRRTALGMIGATALTGTGLAGCGPRKETAAGKANPPAKQTTRIRFATDWRAQAEHGGFYQALASGEFARRGLDVEIIQGGPGVNVPQLLATGAVEAGMGSNSFIQMNLAQEHAPVKAVAAFFQKDPQVLLAHPDPALKSIADLKGRPFLLADASVTAFWVWLKAKYGFTDDQVRKYNYNLAPFLADLDSFLQTAAGYDSADALLENMSDSITQYAREALLYQAVAEAMDIAPTQEQVDTYSTYTETYGANYCTMVALMDAVSDALTTGAQVA